MIGSHHSLKSGERWSYTSKVLIQPYDKHHSPPHSPLTRDSKASPAPGSGTGAKGKAAVKKGAKKQSQPEDKPFDEFVPQLLMPAITQACGHQGGPKPKLHLKEGPMPVVGSQCWQILGELPGLRRFWLCFDQPDINSRKTFALADSGKEPSLLEPFLIDEKRASLALLSARVVQRLHGQKWLGPN